jgi:hypothetical protein
MRIKLTRTQLDQLLEIMQQHASAEDVEITFGYGSGIGTNIYATVTHAGQEHTTDITDYENW